MLVPFFIPTLSNQRRVIFPVVVGAAEGVVVDTLQMAGRVHGHALEAVTDQKRTGIDRFDVVAQLHLDDVLQVSLSVILVVSAVCGKIRVYPGDREIFVGFRDLDVLRRTGIISDRVRLAVAVEPEFKVGRIAVIAACVGDGIGRLSRYGKRADGKQGYPAYKTAKKKSCSPCAS